MTRTILTADCKKFLVSEIAKNPNIIHDIFDDNTTAINEALIEKNWVRTAKFNPAGLHDRVQSEYNLWHPVYGPSCGNVDASKLSAIRIFQLVPNKFDSAVAFIVLEDRSGNLMLGEYIGD